MERILSIEDAKKLNIKEKFYCIYGGQCRGYLYAGENPTYDNLIIAVDDSNYEKIVSLNKRDFETKVILKGKYISEEVGLIMIDQLKERIVSVERIWMKNVVT